MTVLLKNIIRAFALATMLATAVIAQPARKASVGRLEASFQLPGITGNPFNDEENSVRVKLRLPDGKTVTVPAFFDGGATWRVRWMPGIPGKYAWSDVTRNGKAVTPTNYIHRESSVSAADKQGYIRLKQGVFRFENNARYYPLGHNVAWGGGADKTVADITKWFDKMGQAGENWSRVWMCHWDGKNLDWNVRPGEIDLEAARRWDAILAAAERNGIHFQMVLQHHGPYSSNVNSNWGENPWNAKNGGFLSAPEEFFTSDKARSVTRAKFRYIVARYGYSPSVLAWELFNEVEWTDGVRKHPETVTAWHKEMANVLRTADPWKHLVTTSSTPSVPGMYEAIDYLQPHRYQMNPIALASTPVDKGLPERPAFLGEFGADAGGTIAQEANFLTTALFTSLMHHWQGAAQYWYWDKVEQSNLYSRFAAVATFLKETKLPEWKDTRPVDFKVQTSDAGELTARPGRGWDKSGRTEYEITSDGDAVGFQEMSSFFQGTAHRDMFPEAVIRINAPKAVTFTVRFGKAAKAGARVLLEKDGQKAGELNFAASGSDSDTNAELAVSLSPGAHTIRLTNPGADWVTIREIHVTPIGPTLRAFGKVSKDAVAGYVYRSAAVTTSGKGVIILPVIPAGKYRLHWRNAVTGASVSDSEIVVGTTPARLTTPPVPEAVVFWLQPRK
jgi:hypothetical protein